MTSADLDNVLKFSSALNLLLTTFLAFWGRGIVEDMRQRERTRQDINLQTLQEQISKFLYPLSNLLRRRKNLIRIYEAQKSDENKSFVERTFLDPVENDILQLIQNLYYLVPENFSRKLLDEFVDYSTLGLTLGRMWQKRQIDSSQSIQCYYPEELDKEVLKHLEEKQSTYRALLGKQSIVSIAERQ